MTWILMITRMMGILEVWMATDVYPKMSVRDGGFNLRNVILSKNGIISRYVVKEDLDEFGALAKKGDFMSLLKGFKEYEESVLPFFTKDPIENRAEFIKIFRQLWIHEITSFFLGEYITDQKAIDIISDLRGINGSQHIAISDFLPKLLLQISEKTGIDQELLKYALPEEIVSLKFDVEALLARKKQCVIDVTAGKLKLLVGDEAVAYTNKFMKSIKKDIDENISELKGNSAFKGVVSGRVVVVANENDLKKVKEGDVIVSIMTRTSFLSAMKIAVAYITDEGGITCHAAIIARELKKPCVVATKIATKVLKDGDMVEVDANKGTIKIIE